MIKKYPSPSVELLNLFRAQVLNQSATDVQSMMWTAPGRSLLNETLSDTGIITFENEILALGKYLSLGIAFIHTGPLIGVDIKAIADLEQQEGEALWSNPRSRRKVLTHKVTIAKKQAKQLNVVNGLARGIDLVHRFV